MSIVMPKEGMQRIARVLLESVRGESLAEVEVALNGLLVAVNRALGCPDGMIDGGVRSAIGTPAVRELSPLVEAIEWKTK